MARNIQRLSALKVEKIKKPGYYADGAGLWLQVSPTGTRSWIFRFMLNGRAREMGLGPLHTISLADARIQAQNCRKLLRDGIDPIDDRKAKGAAQRLAKAKAITFSECAKAYIETHRAGWRNVKHAAQWESTIETYAGPFIGSLSVADVDTGLVMNCLEPIWKTKTETASRLRGRIESILDWAKTRGYRDGENPARWRGHLDNLLPKQSKVSPVEHHPALPYVEMAPFMKSLRLQEGIGARALEFAILTIARTGEVIGARWDEINTKAAIWIVPADRMKAQREHRVPLSKRAVEIIKEMREIRCSDFVFPGARTNKSLSNMALLSTLKRMERSDLTAHGFRSTFRDWAAETTAYPREAAEMALAHTVGDKVEAAYRRGDLYEKRCRMMEDWATYCNAVKKSQGRTVVPIRKRKFA